MYKNKSFFAIIPARGGSKGVPRKNIRELKGKPLIAWTIEEAKKSKFIDRLIVSTDDQEIIQVAQKWSCEVPFVRPIELARDDTPGIEPIIHAIQMIPGYDYVIMLQPTSPLRKASDIDEAIEHTIVNNAKVCVSVTETDKSPYWMYFVNTEGKIRPVIKSDKPILRRQDLPKVFALNGAIYVAKCEWLMKSRSFLTDDTIPFIMPKERSLDIDTEYDFALIECLK